MKSVAKIVTALILAVCLIGCTCPVSADETEKDIIHVSGTGNVKVSPDLCYISLSVETTGTDVKLAQQENAENMNNVLAALKSIEGCTISDDDIQTSSYSISEVYYPDEKLTAKYGEDATIYRVSNNIEIKTSQLDGVGAIIDTAVAAGANDVDYVNFDLTPTLEQQYRSEALTKAVEKAKSDAVVVLGTLGRDMGSVKEVNVDEGYYPPVYSRSANAYYSMEAAGAPTPISPGYVEVTAHVTIDYRIL